MKKREKNHFRSCLLNNDFFHIFKIFFLNDFIMNPHSRNARAFLPLNTSAVGSVITFAFRNRSVVSNMLHSLQ